MIWDWVEVWCMMCWSFVFGTGFPSVQSPFGKVTNSCQHWHSYGQETPFNIGKSTPSLPGNLFHRELEGSGTDEWAIFHSWGPLRSGWGWRWKGGSAGEIPCPSRTPCWDSNLVISKPYIEVGWCWLMKYDEVREEKKNTSGFTKKDWRPVFATSM